MPDIAVPAKTYFRQHRKNIRTFAIVSIARAVWRGEPLMTLDDIAEEDGFELESDVPGTPGIFVPRDRLRKMVIDLTRAALPGPRMDVPGDTVILPARAGTHVPNIFEARPEAAPETFIMPCDGYVLQSPRGAAFLNDFELSAMFNYNGRRLPPPEGSMLFSLPATTKYKGIVMPEDKLLTFPTVPEPVRVEKYSLLFRSKDDPGGLNVMPRLSAQRTLRVLPRHAPRSARPARSAPPRQMAATA